MMKKQTELLWQGDEPARIRTGETVRLKFPLREVGRNARLMLRGEPAADLMHLSERGSELFCRDIDVAGASCSAATSMTRSRPMHARGASRSAFPRGRIPTPDGHGTVSFAVP